ncbi:MAG: archease [Deltaproteobacteria bacterium]|nr:archease [Deltaproteobacteria bacterium]
MSYRYIGEIATADIAFEATGESLEEVFIAAAEALTNVMIDEPDKIERKEKVEVRLENADAEMLLFDFLGELVYYKDARRLFLRVDEIRITKEDSGYGLSAVLSGEAPDPEKHQLGADVKAVTLHMFALEQTDNGWKATVVLDI